MAATKRKAKRIAKRYWPLGVAAIFLVLFLAVWAVVPANVWIEVVARKISQLGWAAPIVYVALYVAGTLVLAPSPLMSIAAGVAFGWWGFPLAVVAATAGATVSFVLCRYFLKDDLEDWLTDKRIFKAAKHAVDEQGWKILVLLRLSPAVPFGMLNYLMGLTKIPLGMYVWSTTLGILPGSFVDIYIGVVGQKLADGAQGAYLAAGAAVTIASAAAITIKARDELREAGVGKR